MANRLQTSSCQVSWKPLEAGGGDVVMRLWCSLYSLPSAFNFWRLHLPFKNHNNGVHL